MLCVGNIVCCILTNESDVNSVGWVVTKSDLGLLLGFVPSCVTIVVRAFLSIVIVYVSPCLLVFVPFFFVSPETSACTAPDFDYDRAVSMATVRDYWCRRVSQYKPHKFSPTFQRVTPPWVRRQSRLRDYCPHLLLGFILLLVPSSVG